MRIYDIIEKKRDGGTLSNEEIRFAVMGFTNGEIPDYQMSALLMAIFFRGMDEAELKALTEVMMNSGDTVDLSAFGGLSVDKHSTGGVGDKTTLAVAPIVASLGGKVAKMSGRGLGHTGGTVDKLESIPGYRTTLSPEEFLRQVDEIGVAVIGQSGNLAPADKKIYALRDVTATVESIPLIASSIMSKKLAAGTKNIVLDVKIGSGAFMKTPEQAKKLAAIMVGMGKSFSRNISALITNMNEPLGNAVGNSLEVLEAVRVLKGESEGDLDTICKAIASEMLCLCHGWDKAYSNERVDEAILTGKALNKFREWIAAQGGSTDFIDNYPALGAAPVAYTFKVTADGFVSHINAELIGKAAVVLGAGREKAGDTIDHTAGIMLKRHVGDPCMVGDTFAVLYTSDESRLNDACALMKESLTLSTEKPEKLPLIYDIVR